MSARYRVIFLALAAVALVTGVWGGLLRAGWAGLGHRLIAHVVLQHGALMISGVLGTVIGLERAVALGRPWAYAGPALSAAGALAALLKPDGRFPLLALLPQVLWLAAGAVLVAVYVQEWRAHTRSAGPDAPPPDRMPVLVMGGGAVAWLLGSGAALFGGLPLGSVHLWVLFLVLTIAGERLELGRLANLAAARRTAFLVVAGVTALGPLVTLAGGGGPGARFFGAGLLALSVWLAFNDVARYTIRRPGLPRYVAVCLLSGYVWLAVGGALLLRYGAVSAGLQYDAALHCVLLGFVFAMIFGHAPIIIPAVIGLAVPYRVAFYVPLVLLHLGVAARVGADLAGSVVGRQHGAMTNTATLVLFAATLLYSIRRGPPPAPAVPAT